MSSWMQQVHIRQDLLARSVTCRIFTFVSYLMLIASNILTRKKTFRPEP